MRVQLVQRQRLEAALLRDHDLTLASYDVMLQLSWAPDGRLRPVDIARFEEYSDRAGGVSARRSPRGL